MNHKNGLKDSRAELELFIKEQDHPEKINAALRDAFGTLSKLLPDAMTVPDVAVALTRSVILGPLETRTGLLKAGAELGELKGQLILAVIRILNGKGTLVSHMEEIEREVIRMALNSARSKGDAAKLLGIPQSTLSTKLRRFGLKE
ncbi:MAG: helix-turn-helix domain-containing protein [Deltaproteobacteria bacterium]|nr:helix-turn-helix domain-containing protein [Deltaproteobacteria bacterium]